MKQFQFSFKDGETLDRALAQLRKIYDDSHFSGVLIHIYTESVDREKIEKALSRIDEVLPEAVCVGCSTNGNIVDGDFSGEPFALICSFFEYSSTKVKLLQYKLTEETQAEISDAVVGEVAENDWVKGVEFVLTIRGMSLTGLCDGLSKVREGVQIFGGGAFSADVNIDDACVFSNKYGFEEKGIAFILIGGEDLHIFSSFVSGWKPLGSFLNVTSAEGCVMKELNDRPAYETYFRYLKIKNDENFFFHTLEFPFLYRDKDIDIMRAPVSCNPDGSLVMTSDIPRNARIRLAYGDPWTILESTREEADRLEKFTPDCVIVFSCAGRRTFWGNDKVGSETEAYQEVAPTSGFYTSSEFLGNSQYVHQHNVTQVLAAMREGDVKETRNLTFSSSNKAFDGKVPMINRMAAFIKATMEELEDANRRFSIMAKTDALTGLLNRGEIQRVISDSIDDGMINDIYLIMMDLDNFKHVNDQYGHKEGDNVLIRLSGMLRETMADLGLNCYCGRWGGEEFMIMIHSTEKSVVTKHAERIRKTMEKIRFENAGQVTVSVGVTKVHPAETADKACIRVDNALYEAKNSGKNRVVFVE